MHWLEVSPWHKLSTRYNAALKILFFELLREHGLLEEAHR